MSAPRQKTRPATDASTRTVARREEGVETGGDDPRTLVGNRPRSIVPRSTRELFDEERISFGHLGHLRGTLRNGSCGKELLGELLAALIAERIELQRRIRRKASTPGRPLAKELRPRERHEHDRHVADA